MKRIVKYLIPCLVACFMVFGLVQTASFTFAEVQDDQTTQATDSGTNYVLDNPNGNLDDNSSASGEDTKIVGSDDKGTSEVGDAGDDVNPTLLNEGGDEEDFVNPDSAVIDTLASGEVSSVIPDHEKSITKMKGTDQYQLNLNIKGFSTSETNKPKVDVLLVIDVSGSMNYQISEKDKSSRISALKTAIYGDSIGTNEGVDGLADSILSNDQIEAQMAIVTYSNSADIIQNWTSDLSAFEKSVDNITTGGATNSTDGLIKAKKALKSVENDGAEKYVIFLTDGKPTYYIGDDEYSGPIDIESMGITLSPSNITGYEKYYYGSDNNVYYKQESSQKYSFINEETTEKKPDYTPQISDPIHINTDGNEIGREDTGWHYIYRQNDWFYGHYGWVKTENYYQYQYNENLGPHGNGRNFEILGAMYSTICAKSIASASNVHFYSIGYGSEATDPNDKCYQYLNNMPGEFIEADDSGDLVKFFNKLVSETTTYEISSVTINDVLSEYVELPSGTTNEKVILTVTEGSTPIDINTLGIHLNTVISSDGKSISATIVNNDETPYTLNKNYTYTISFPIQPNQTAYNYYSQNLGYPKDSDGESLDGFYSNADSGVNIVYTYKEKENRADYQEKPTVQVTMNSLNISKLVTGSYGDKTKDFRFTLEITDENGKPVSGTYGSSNGENVNFENGKMTFTLKNDEEFNISNLPKNFRYTVTEDSYDDYETKYNGSVNPASGTFDLSTLNVEINVVNDAEAVPLTGLTDNTPKGLGMIGTIVAEVVAIAFVLKKKRKLKM